MIHLSLKEWSGKFEGRGVLAKIRRAIAYHLASGECVLVLDDGAAGLTAAVRTELERGWASGKVLFSRTHPELGGPVPKTSRRPRRKL